jgi:hypothetical protein
MKDFSRCHILDGDIVDGGRIDDHLEVSVRMCCGTVLGVAVNLILAIVAGGDAGG